MLSKFYDRLQAIVPEWVLDELLWKRRLPFSPYAFAWHAPRNGYEDCCCQDCECCPGQTERIGPLGECLCDPPYICADGTLLSPPNCDCPPPTPCCPGQTWNGSTCVPPLPPCPPGQVRSNCQCVPEPPRCPELGNLCCDPSLGTQLICGDGAPPDPVTCNCRGMPATSGSCDVCLAQVVLPGGALSGYMPDKVRVTLTGLKCKTPRHDNTACRAGGCDVNCSEAPGPIHCGRLCADEPPYVPTCNSDTHWKSRKCDDNNAEFICYGPYTPRLMLEYTPCPNNHNGNEGDSYIVWDPQDPFPTDWCGEYRFIAPTTTSGIPPCFEDLNCPPGTAPGDYDIGCGPCLNQGQPCPGLSGSQFHRQVHWYTGWPAIFVRLAQHAGHWVWAIRIAGLGSADGLYHTAPLPVDQQAYQQHQQGLPVRYVDCYGSAVAQAHTPAEQRQDCVCYFDNGSITVSPM